MMTANQKIAFLAICVVISNIGKPCPDLVPALQQLQQTLNGAIE